MTSIATAPQAPRGGRSAMLTINVSHASNAELIETVTKDCALFGTVRAVKVYATPSNPSLRPYALVAMATREDAERLAAACGGRTMGKSVVVRLQLPETATASVDDRAVDPK